MIGWTAGLVKSWDDLVDEHRAEHAMTDEDAARVWARIVAERPEAATMFISPMTRDEALAEVARLREELAVVHAAWRAWLREMESAFRRSGDSNAASAVAACACDDVGPDNPDED
jgi:hypothetical protein